MQYGSPKMFMKKSDSERALVTQDRFVHKHRIIFPWEIKCKLIQERFLGLDVVGHQG